MEENIRFMFKTKDGLEHKINVSGACTLTDAVFELVSSILNGDLKVNPKDIVAYIDIEG